MSEMKTTEDTLCLRPYRSCDAEAIIKWIGDECSRTPDHEIYR